MKETYTLTAEEHFAKMLRMIALDFDKRMNPVFEGHRTTYPGASRITMGHAIGYGLMVTSPSALYSAAAYQLYTTPGRSVSIDRGPGGSYHLGGGDDFYYPGKGIVEFFKQ
jgi:hypothetical protein